MKIPKKLFAANTPTPVQTLSYEGRKFLIKRDDLTGAELSGNKIRKLEYLIYQTKKEKADYIFTSGGLQSNHARATAICAAREGIKTKLFLWGKNTSSPVGNLFLDKFIGAEIQYLTKKENENVNQLMYSERQKYLSKGKQVYVIPEGGSTTLGIWGYISFVEELKNQIDLNKIKGIFAACGSGGTAAGLLAGLALHNFQTKVFAVNVLYPESVIRKKILNLAEGAALDYNLNINLNEDRLQIVDGYSEEGYENISADKLKLIKDFARSTGIIFDPAYTGKAFTAYYEKILTQNKGRDYLFIHTGGLFGVFGKKTQYLSA